MQSQTPAVATTFISGLVKSIPLTLEQWQHLFATLFGVVAGFIRGMIEAHLLSNITLQSIFETAIHTAVGGTVCYLVPLFLKWLKKRIKKFFK